MIMPRMIAGMTHRMANITTIGVNLDTIVTMVSRITDSDKLAKNWNSPPIRTIIKINKTGDTITSIPFIVLFFIPYLDYIIKLSPAGFRALF